MRRFSIIILGILAFPSSLPALDLSVGPDDVLIEQRIEGGYMLIVRKKADIESVLLTESTEDPEVDSATYALRNPKYHPENGDEKRMLDGEFLDNDLYSLIDSSPEPDTDFGRAFRIFIPYIVEYGYPWSRNGEIMVLDGTYLSIRSFSRPYADYRGEFKDNPFILRVKQKPIAGPPEANYMPDTVNEYKKIAEDTDGKSIFSPGEHDMVEKIIDFIAESEGESLDLVLALDTTSSMQNDIPHLQETLVPMLREHTNRFKRFRVGVVYYRDYMEEYLTKSLDFQDNLDYVQRIIDTIRVQGGRDLPEAVNEALYASVVNFPWLAETRMVILIGDAPPHPKPRGKITREMVYDQAKARSVKINTIILPQ